MAPLNGLSNVEAAHNGVNGVDEAKSGSSLTSAFVDTRTGEPIDVEAAFPGMPEDKLPDYVKKSRVHFDDLPNRIKAATHAGVKGKHLRAVTVLGRIGWVAKGIVYGLIGGLCCRGAISEDLNIDASPQGAFVLIGKGAAGIYILIVMAVALATYIIWRFWEGITAQGSHPCYTKFTNFFRFRLSPLVSGGVYCAYLGYIIVLIPKAIDYHNDAVNNSSGSDFTKSWQSSAFGRFGLVMVGLAFLIAVIVMLQGAFTKKFHRELRLKELRPWVKWLTLITGHLGALGRAGLFLLVSVLMWRALDGNDTPDPTAKEKNTIGRAFTQLQENAWGQAILFLIGFGLILYALFACLNAYPAKIFPTPLPSEAEMDEMIRKRQEKAQKKAHKRAQAHILKDNSVPVREHSVAEHKAANSKAAATGPNAV